MNRQNFLGRLALALTLVLLAAFAGQMRRMDQHRHEGHNHQPTASVGRGTLTAETLKLSSSPEVIVRFHGRHFARKNSGSCQWFKRSPG
ncbi:MAG: hypothetical protein WKF84_01530 [Pyrinomonadaceae bacterium]